MIFRNKNKYLMYKTMIKFNKCNSMQETQKSITTKYKIDDNYYSYIIRQCVEQQYLDGIVATKSINNIYHIVYTDNIYITCNGFEFLKNYYSNIKSLLRDIFLILITAVITVIINNKWSNVDKTIDIINNVCPQTTIR